MIVLDGLTFSYSGSTRPVLEDVSLSIRTGESVCIMGSNGSGKSTLALILAGLIRGHEGSVTIKGQTAGGDGTHAGVGLLLQNPDNQMVATLVDKEIAFGLENLAVPLERMKQQVPAIAESFHISHLLNRLTTELSGGEKQRVALASLMIRKPPILILDEPDSFLDVAGRKILEEELSRIRTQLSDLIEIRITQYPSVAMNYPRLIVLHDGRVAADRTPSNFFADHTLATRTGLTCQLSDSGEHPADSHLYPSFGDTETALRSICMKDVSFGFSSADPVLQRINLTLRAGETLGLVGPTGVGKSTLGLLLCGIYQPQKGSVCLVNGQGEEKAADSITGQIAGLFQQPERQFFLTSCAAEVAFGPGNMGQPLSEVQLASFFDLVGLEYSLFAERDPFSLSMGEKRRLAFAAVLSMAPKFIVFDEPTCGLDPRGVGKFLDLSKRLRRNGIGQMVISHDTDLLETLADSILCLNGDGGLKKLSPTEFFGNDLYAGLLSSRSGLVPGLNK